MIAPHFAFRASHSPFILAFLVDRPGQRQSGDPVTCLYKSLLPRLPHLIFGQQQSSCFCASPTRHLWESSDQPRNCGPSLPVLNHLSPHPQCRSLQQIAFTCRISWRGKLSSQFARARLTHSRVRAEDQQRDKNKAPVQKCVS